MTTRSWWREKETRSKKPHRRVLPSLWFHVVTYDEDGNPLLNKTEVNLITAVHRESSYEPFTKDFYPSDTSTSDDVKAWEKENEVEIHNLLSDKELKTPSPCLHFNEFGFPSKLLSLIQKHNFVSPTPIQVPFRPVSP